MIEFNSRLRKINKILNEINEKSSIIKISLALEENKTLYQIIKKQKEDFLKVSFYVLFFLNIFKSED